MYKTEGITLYNWDEEHGIVIYENEKLVLVKHILDEYLTDGFRVYNKDFIEKRSAGEIEKRKELVFQLSNINIDIPADFPSLDIKEVINWCDKNLSILEFITEDQDDVFYAKLNSIDKETLDIFYVEADGIVDNSEHIFIPLDEIRSLSFLSNYQTSLHLLHSHVE